jgi:hypothetical protein
MPSTQGELGDVMDAASQQAEPMTRQSAVVFVQFPDEAVPELPMALTWALASWGEAVVTPENDMAWICRQDTEAETVIVIVLLPAVALG